MNNHPYHHSFAAEEAFRRVSREIERRQLIQTIKGQNTGQRNSLAAWARRTHGSILMDLNEARPWWAESSEPQEECC